MLFTRSEMVELRDKASEEASRVPNPHWKWAYQALAEAADRLDAVMGRCAISMSAGKVDPVVPFTSDAEYARGTSDADRDVLERQVVRLEGELANAECTRANLNEVNLRFRHNIDARDKLVATLQAENGQLRHDLDAKNKQLHDVVVAKSKADVQQLRHDLRRPELEKPTVDSRREDYWSVCERLFKTRDTSIDDYPLARVCQRIDMLLAFERKAVRLEAELTAARSTGKGYLEAIIPWSEHVQVLNKLADGLRDEVKHLKGQLSSSCDILATLRTMHKIDQHKAEPIPLDSLAAVMGWVSSGGSGTAMDHDLPPCRPSGPKRMYLIIR